MGRNFFPAYCKQSRLCKRCKVVISSGIYLRSYNVFNHLLNKCVFIRNEGNIGETLYDASITFPQQFNSWLSGKNITKASRTRVEKMILSQQTSTKDTNAFWAKPKRVKVLNPNTCAKPTGNKNLKQIYTTASHLMKEIMKLKELSQSELAYESKDLAHQSLLDIHSRLTICVSDRDDEDKELSELQERSRTLQLSSIVIKDSDSDIDDLRQLCKMLKLKCDDLVEENEKLKNKPYFTDIHVGQHCETSRSSTSII